MFTHAYRDDILNALRGTGVSAWTGHAGLITAISDFRAGTVTEATYTGYGTRPSITFGAPANTSPTGGRQVGNSGAVTFPQNTGANQDMIAWGVWSASTGGVLRKIGFLDADPPILGTAATSDTITAPAHGLSNDQRIRVLACPGAAIPTGLSENTTYWVINVAADTFQLSTTQGGGAVDITASGAAFFMPFTPVTVATNATPEFGVGTLVIQI